MDSGQAAIAPEKRLAVIEPTLALCQTPDMDEWLFVLQADAIAQKQTGYRPGARHALMVFLTAPDEEVARQRAQGVIKKRHWLEGRVKRIKQLFDPDLVEDDTLRSAAETALEKGDAIVVYKDEIPHDG